MPGQARPAIKVYFEVTNHCNFNCDFCPTGESTRPRRHMDLALFQKGIDDVVAGQVARTVGFHILGEPLLYPSLLDAIRYARARGLRTEINTNGSLLTAPRVRQLVDAGLDGLSISLQILGDDHRCRGSGIPFARYYRTILDAVSLIRASGSTMDLTVCYMNTATRRLFDIDRLIRVDGHGDRRARLLRLVLDLCAAAGHEAPRAQVAASLRRLSLVEPRLVRIDDRTAVFVQPLADWGNAFTTRRVHPARIGYCAYALTNIGVLNDGRVTICCVDYDGQTSLGNLGSASLASLLASEQAQAVREGFRRLRLAHPFCQRCVGSPSRLKALLKGLASIYLFKLLGFQPGRVKETSLLPA